MSRKDEFPHMVKWGSKYFHEEDLGRKLRERWDWWQNFLTEAGASDYEANQMAHAVQGEIETIARDLGVKIFKREKE